MAQKKSIVIVGGGGAGAALARALSAKLDSSKHSLTLLSSRDYFLHQPGAIRMIVTSQGELENLVLVPFDKLFHNGNGTFRQATVTSIVAEKNGAGGHVETEGGEEIHFDVLILASGSTWEGGINVPFRRDEAIPFIQEWREKFKKSNGVAIVGGGPVGIELAGEIRDIYKDKKVTLIHNKPHLLSEVYPDKFRKYMESQMTHRQIHLVLNDAINDIPPEKASNVVTANGVRVDADLVVPTRGGRPNTDFIASLGEGVLSSDGRVKVDPTLQVTGFPGIFAAGDILDWKEVKQVAKYGGHVTTLSNNVLSYLNGQPLPARYKSMFEGILITNGAYGGGTYMDLLWGLVFGNWFTKTLKSKDLFITKTRQSLGY